MGGITAGTGLFSGIDTANLIEQLIASQSRPQILAQRRLSQLQTQQAAYLDINARLNAFKTAAGAFRVNRTFDAKLAASSDDSVLTATAGNSAINGTSNFIVDRLVTTQQLLSRGFADRDTASSGILSMTFEGPEGRIDRDTDLNTLNNGSGINRGTIVVNGQDVDLSRVATVGELLDAVNNSTSGATASIAGGAFVLDGVTSLANKVGSDVLAGLGLANATVAGERYTGSTVYGLGTNTALISLNDGRGVSTRDASGVNVSDFSIEVGGVKVDVRIGELEEMIDGTLTVVEGAAANVGQVVERINAALADAGQTGVAASINTATGAIEFTNTTGQGITISNAVVGGNEATNTAADLGIAGTFAAGSFSGTRILAGMNTTLVSSLNGGTGLGATDGVLEFTAADGTGFSVNVSGATTVAEVIGMINNDANNAGRVRVSLNPTGNGLQAVDTSGGAGPLVIAGTGGADAAAALGLAGSFAGGTSTGANLQLAYLGRSSLLGSLNGGQGIGTGTFEIVDSNSLSARISITSSDRTLGDVIDKINDEGLAVRARINDTGDGIIIEEFTDEANGIEPGGALMRITDTEGSVAGKLRIAGEAAGTGGENFIDGSFETTLDFEAGATLADVVRDINASGAGVRATIINDGSSANPYRLSLVAESSGVDGRFLLDTRGVDLGLNTLEAGQDARIFYGSNDPAKGVLVNSSTNTVEGLIDGVTISLKKVSTSPVTLSITTNNEEIEKKITEMVDAFNAVIERLDFQTRYNDETKERGPLLGDGTAISLRQRMFSAVRDTNDGFTDTFNSLAQVGVVAGAGGKLTFNAERFRAAYAQDPEAVEALFVRRDITPTATPEPDANGVTVINPDATTTFDALGVVGQLEQLADTYVSSIGGVLQNRSTALDSQITLQRGRIDSIQRTLDSKRDILQRQFLAMEQAIASFQSQGSALSQIQLIG